jgi:hypothetical protein
MGALRDFYGWKKTCLYGKIKDQTIRGGPRDGRYTPGFSGRDGTGARA